MAKGILGRKLGMTQIFDAAGNWITVTGIRFPSASNIWVMPNFLPKIPLAMSLHLSF